MANEKRLIDANALIDKFWQEECRTQTRRDFVAMVNYAPTVEALEVVHGRWTRKQVGKYTGVDEVCCSICGDFIGVVSSDTGFEEAVKGMNYCPNCGAKMDGGDENGC